MTTAAAASPVLDTRRPFTRADALAAGISPAQIRGSRFRRIFRGVYIDAAVPESCTIRTKAALLIHPPEAFASHFSSAQVRGLPVPEHANVHITVWEAGHRVYRLGITCHASQFPVEREDVTVVDGMRVSAPCRMFVELASVLSLVDLVVVGDAMVRLKMCTREELVAYCGRCPAHHAADARRAASYVRDGVDSPMETRVRMLIVLAGLPEPKVNFKVYDRNGVLVYRFDLSYPDLGLIVEYDGRQHADDTAQWNHDLERREWIDDENLRIIVVTSRGVYREPARTIERVRRALSDRGHHVPVSALSQEWRRFFPAS